MQILHKIDDFITELFPRYKASNNDVDVLKDEIANYYSYGPYKPKVTISEGWVTITIDTPAISSQEAAYRKVVQLCERGKYVEAKKLLLPLIQQNPANSEYHRILGQISSDEGDQEEAINSLIDSLKWDPKNGFALVMMGNIFAKYKDDIQTAMKYYDQALIVNPEDHIAVNNIGANLLQKGKTEEGIKYLEKAYAINPNYPNTPYGLSVAYNYSGFPSVAFDYAIKAIKASHRIDTTIYFAADSIAKDLAKELCKAESGMKAFEQFKSYLERRTGTEIRVEKDPSIPTAAKIEFAENHDRQYHVIKYKPHYIAVEHLLMHELVHLEFSTDAKLEHSNMLFLSGFEKKSLFIRDHEKDLSRLHKKGYNEESIANFISSLYEGINRQVFNTPIDLFIEDYIFENYPELHPYQFLSLQQHITEGKDAVTDGNAVFLAPRNILSASKILNILNARHFKDLYGVDILKEFDASPSETKVVEGMWSEFLDYRQDRSPGEEYEIIKHWGADLKLDKYYELVDEDDYRARPRTIEDVLDSIEDDPFGLDVDKNFKEKETTQFLASEESIGTNQAIVWFMVDAMKFFDSIRTEEIKKIAFEIALIGTQGINPATGHNYKVNSIPRKDFSGYHLLAYYYVSWMLAIPEMVPQLNLPYEEEYSLAKKIHEADAGL